MGECWMTASFEKPLPNALSGAVCKQFVRRGPKLYGPYHYRFWREGGRLRKQYVRPAHLEATVAACEKNRVDRRSLARNRRLLRDCIGDLSVLVRVARAFEL